MRPLDLTPDETVDSRRCADVSKAMDSDPVGSAGSYDLFVLVETALPWPAEVTDDPVLGAVAAAIAEVAPGRRVRVQAIVGGHEPGPSRRLVVWQASDGAAPTFTRREAVAAPGEVVAAAVALVAGKDATGPAGDGVEGDLLICTHGGRDRCCGSDGTRLFRAVEAPAGVRVWRTSHTGGHRFAPTAMSFPDGLSWARLTPRLVGAIHARAVHPRRLVPHYRGAFAFSSSFLQAAERAVFAEVGWDWLRWSRWGEQASDTVGRIGFRTPAGLEGAYLVEVVEHRRLPVPVCGDDLSAARKSEPEWRVVTVERER